MPKFLLTLCCCFLLHAAAKPQSVKLKDGTAEMVQILQDLVRNGNPRNNYSWNQQRADYYRAQIAHTTGQDQLRTWYNFCLETLNAGNPELVISEIEGYLASLNQPFEELLTGPNQPLYELLALSYLRLGENENCQNNHNPASCILPLQSNGIHQLKNGSQKAKEIYLLLLSKYPSDKYKWLLNLAVMTLGNYPEGVPEEYLIPFPNPDLEQSDFPAFPEIAMETGLAVNGLSGGTCVEDFNKDGLLDVFCTSYGMQDQVRLFFNDGKGKYVDVTQNAGLTGITGGLNCLHADFDNDGWIDILVLRGGWLHEGGKQPNSLLRNMGDGTFQDVTRAAGILSFHPTQTAAWCDFDRDGDLDLFIGNESTDNEIHACELFRNKGDGTFEEVADEVGLGGILGYVKGCAWGDINHDRRMDLYVSILGGENLLFLNENGKFREIGAKAGVQRPYDSFPCWFWDVNNDGWEDLFVGAYDLKMMNELAGEYAAELSGKTLRSETPKLYLNQGDMTFRDVTEEYQLNRTMYAMGANFGDLDNDGFLDFYVGTGAPDFSTVVPNRMFRNVEGKRFEEVTSAGNFGHIQKGHGVAFADLDRDGDQDIYAVMGGAYEGDDYPNILYENPLDKNRWIVIELKGLHANYFGMGCWLEVKLKSGRSIFRTVGSGGSFGASPLQEIVGIGREKMESISVQWTNGVKITINDPPKPGSMIRFMEDSLEKPFPEIIYEVRDYEPVPLR